MQLGKLEKIDNLRKIWPHETLDLRHGLQRMRIFLFYVMQWGLI